MARLRSSKQERFAELIAADFPQGEAYAIAGYKGDRGSASRLNRKPHVIARVQELRGPDGLPMAERRRNLIAHFMRVGRRAEALRSAAALGVAKAAYVEVGKILGVFDAAAPAAEPPSLHNLPPVLSEEAWLAEVHTYLASQSAEDAASDN